VAADGRTMFWRTIKAGTKYHAKEFDDLVKHDGLAIFCISYNGFMTKKGKNAVWKFLKRRKVFYVLDESHEIKTPKAKRTRSVVASGKYAEYKRILTGTPGDKPFDIYSQLRFINPNIWYDQHMGSFAAFKQRYANWWTRAQAKELDGYDPGYDKLLGYKNLDELAETLAGHSDRVLKEDVLDLPPKLYTKRYFEMTAKQQSAYDQLRDELELELENGDIVDGTMAIVRLLRLQQITCGYVACEADEPVQMIDNQNPRLAAAVDFVEPLSHQSIIWARFRPDIDQLMYTLGDEAVRYDGAVDDEQAAQNKEAFNRGDAKYFVGNPQKGSTGLTLNAAKTTLYYSNSFKLLERLQTEDRNHRIGQDGDDHGEHGFGVLYGDMCAPDTVDDKIIKALRKKYDIAATLTKDDLREWI